jgi:hypothetical protein
MKLSPRSFSFALLTFLWLSSSGSGMEHGKGGFIDRAIAEDAAQQGSIATARTRILAKGVGPDATAPTNDLAPDSSRPHFGHDHSGGGRSHRGVAVLSANEALAQTLGSHAEE